MADFDYNSMVAGARDMIASAGRYATISYTVKAPNPDKPWEQTGQTVKRPQFMAVFLTPKEKFIDGSVVIAGEKKVLCAPLNPPLTREQAMGAVIESEGKKWTVNAFAETRPGSVTVLYTFKVAG
ncbi:MAG: hypothetical protein RR619_02735 [Raoultibacter sp.]